MDKVVRTTTTERCQGPVTIRSPDPSLPFLGSPEPVATDAAARRGTLLVWLPGTGAHPNQYTDMIETAAAAGFHAVSLDYENENSQSINFDICPRQPSNCFENARLEILTGEDSGYLEPDVDPRDSAHHRLLRLIEHEAAAHPDQGWDRYLAGDAIRWTRVVVGGHSQGGGHATLTAKLHRVARVLLYSATEPAPWTTEPFATPPEDFWGVVHAREPIYSGIVRSWEQIGLPGAPTEVRTGPPGGNSHRLVTDESDCGGDPSSNGYYHNCYIVSPWMPPPATDGTPAFAALWRHTLLAP